MPAVPAGVNEIVAENSLPDTPGWRIATPDRAMGQEIAGHIPRPSVEQGNAVMVHVNRTGPDAGKPYTVEIFRLGWYGGVGARLVLGPRSSDAFRARDLADVELDYLFLDGSHFKVYDGSRASRCCWPWSPAGTSHMTLGPTSSTVSAPEACDRRCW